MKNKQSFYKCKNCGDEIGVNTNSRLIYCQCGKLGVDGNEFYVRVVGDGEFEVVEKKVIKLKNLSINHDSKRRS